MRQKIAIIVSTALCNYITQAVWPEARLVSNRLRYLR